MKKVSAQLNILMIGFFLLFHFGCKKAEITEPTFKAVTPLQKQMVEAWIKDEGKRVSFNEKLKINSVSDNLNWAEASVADLTSGKNAVNVPIKGKKNLHLSLQVNSTTGAVSAATIFEIQLNEQKNRSNQDIILDHLTGRPNTNTTLILAYSINSQLQKAFSYIKGRKFFEKTLVKKSTTGGSGNSNIKINAEGQCYTVWWVTGNNDGSLNWELIDAYCDDPNGPCQTTSIRDESGNVRKINCGGGGGYGSTVPLTPEEEAFFDGYRSKMTAAEIAIFDNELTVLQRTAYIHNAAKAQALAILLYPNSPIHNGVADAFKHGLFIALNAMDIGPLLAIRLANAHENRPGQPNLEAQMDTKNNQKGLEVFLLMQSMGMVNSVMIEATIGMLVNSGQFWMISNLDASGNITGSSQLVATAY